MEWCDPGACKSICADREVSSDVARHFPWPCPCQPGHYRREPGGDKCVQAGTDKNTVSGGSDFLLKDTCCILLHLHLGHHCQCGTILNAGHGQINFCLAKCSLR